MDINSIKKVGKDFRITIPQEFRGKEKFSEQDTIKFEQVQDGIIMRKISVFEVGDHTDNQRNSYAFATIPKMERSDLLEALRLILNTLEVCENAEN